MLPLIPLIAIGVSGITGATLSPKKNKTAKSGKTPAQIKAIKDAQNHALIQAKIYDFLGKFVKGDVSELWRLIDSFYRPSGGDEKSNLNDASNVWILNGTKVKLFEWARQVVPAPDTPPYTDWAQYDYKGIKEIIQAWQTGGHSLNIGADLKVTYSAIATGASIGTVIPVVGTVVGAVVGGVAGLGVFIADWFDW